MSAAAVVCVGGKDIHPGRGRAQVDFAEVIAKEVAQSSDFFFLKDPAPPEIYPFPLPPPFPIGPAGGADACARRDGGRVFRVLGWRFHPSALRLSPRPSHARAPPRA